MLPSSPVLRLFALAALTASCMSPIHRSRPAPSSASIIEPTSGDDFRDWGKNPWRDARAHPLSTFAADVDTASYTIARRKLTEGELPPTAAVRAEEFVNYFRYALPAPQPGSLFAAALDAAPSPIAPDHAILRVAVGTAARPPGERPPAHLVFLVDVSGSMAGADRLPLAKHALKLLTANLGMRDTVSLVTYAGATRVVLPPTGLAHRSAILAAIDDLDADGSTAMASGLDLAYEQAMRTREAGATSRVIVCTDGDTNVGATSFNALLEIIAARAAAGVTLSTIGFGMGNYKDALLEQLADKGNGNNFYIDSFAAAKKVFAEQLGANLEVIARDVKLQVEFDPARVARYRLVGYENRALTTEQFRDDRVDAGEVGPGHQVTALYEVELTAAGRAAPAPFATLRLRHRPAEGDAAATEQRFAMSAPPSASFAAADADLQFAFAVAAFADVLRGQADAARWSLDAIESIARASAGADADRREFVALIGHARRLRSPAATVAR